MEFGNPAFCPQKQWVCTVSASFASTAAPPITEEDKQVIFGTRWLAQMQLELKGPIVWTVL
jgi:hypothetical protein